MTTNDFKLLLFTFLCYTFPQVQVELTGLLPFHKRWHVTKCTFPSQPTKKKKKKKTCSHQYPFIIFSPFQNLGNGNSYFLLKKFTREDAESQCDPMSGQQPNKWPWRRSLQLRQQLHYNLRTSSSTEKVQLSYIWIPDSQSVK